MSHPAVVLVSGSDPGLRSRAIAEAVERHLGDDDRTLALAETTLPARRGPASQGGGGGEEAPADDSRQAALDSALVGARTPPFGTEKRVVVVRSDDGFAAPEADALAAYLQDPEPTTVLVLEVSDRLPAALSKAAKAVDAEEIGTSPGRGGTADLLATELQRAGLALDTTTRQLVSERLGEDAGRVPAIVDLLLSAHGTGATLGVEDIAPYLGEQGSIPVFELTKAIDAGDMPGALAVATRMTGPMGMHPLQIMAILHSHYRRILRLDDPAIRGEQDAVAALGGKVKPYPAKLAWQQAQRLGTDGIREAFAHLAKADLDLRGATGAPEEAVLEILVSRLAHLTRRRGAGAGGPRGPARSSRAS